jgi:phospholipid/cholesterol/gamma-HCH transport system permease protein
MFSGGATVTASTAVTSPSDPLLSWTTRGGQLSAVASGAWTCANADRLERLTDSLDRQSASTGTLDVSGIGELDTFGGWLIERSVRQANSRMQTMQVAAVPDRYRNLLAALDRTNRQAAAAPVAGGPLAASLAALGAKVSAVGDDLVALVAMFGALTFAQLDRFAKPPQAARVRDTVHHFERVSWQAIPIILLITFVVGAIIAQQGFFYFRKFGAEEYVVNLVGVLVLRELGVLIVAIMVAGRSGSAFTAELGSMKMREEIDALRTMGLDPIDVLALPRVVALVVALPILTFLGALAALSGGALVAWLYGGMFPTTFIVRLQNAVSLSDFEVGLIKAPCMALLIGAVACAEGLRVAGSTVSLGIKTTDSVVKSIFLVIVLDGLFAIFFSAIRM